MIAEVEQDIPVPDLTEAVAGVADQLSDDAVRACWKQVERALSDVFGVSRDDARASISDVRRRIDQNVSADLRVAIYHVDPFQVAADLAGATHRPVTADEKKAYTDIASGLGPRERPAASLLLKQMPDDILASII